MRTKTTIRNSNRFMLGGLINSIKTMISRHALSYKEENTLVEILRRLNELESSWTRNNEEAVNRFKFMTTEIDV